MELKLILFTVQWTYLLGGNNHKIVIILKTICLLLAIGPCELLWPNFSDFILVLWANMILSQFGFLVFEYNFPEYYFSRNQN